MVKSLIKSVVFLVKSFFASPVILVSLLHPSIDIIKYEVRCYLSAVLYRDKPFLIGFYIVFTELSDFRSVLYMRLGLIGSFFKYIYRGQNQFYIFNKSDKVGKGFLVHHPISSRISCRNIGEDCQIWQLVTIGKGKSGPGLDNTPVIGNRVKVCAGAIVVGAIDIGDDVTIAAGAVVTKNVPPGCVVAGNPARIIRRNGIRVSEKL